MARKIPIISLEDFETKAKKPLMFKTEEYEECSKIKTIIKRL